MTSIEADTKYIDAVLRTLHLDPNKVIEFSIEVNYIETKISVQDIKGNSFRYTYFL